tara:strand:+ start:576 stop:1637 length:1062 start_codon:yes stop_codon:yes gene_type:complete
MSNSKFTLGVVFGGLSREHNVSIKSAQTITKALKIGENINKFKIICIYIDTEGRWWGSEVATKALEKGIALKGNELPLQNPTKGFNQLPPGFEKVDIWYPVLHGPNGEDGSIQGLFKLTRKPFVGSGVLGSSLGMDKIAMKAAFTAAGLPQALYQSANASEINNQSSIQVLLKRLEKTIGYPCFIKPANLGSSVGISKASDREQLIQGLKLAAKFDQRIVIEENIIARELECAVLGKNPLKTSLIGEIQHNSDWYDYEAKYSSKKSTAIIPALLSDNISNQIYKLSLAACKAISVEGIARIDFFYNEIKNEVLINEVNTLPGFTSQSMYPLLWAASGLNLEKLVAEIVKTARE